MHHRHPSRRRASMAGGLIATLATAALVAATIQAAPGQAAAPASSDNRHVLQDSGRALSAHTGKSDLSTVKHFLRTKGTNARTLRSLRPAGAAWTYRGVTHQRYEQRVSGLRVYGAEAKAAFNTRGQLVHLVKYTSPVSKTIRPASKSAAAALRATVKDLYPARTIGIRRTGQQGHDDHVRQGPLLPGATERRAGRRTDQGRRVQGRLRGQHLGRAQQQAVLDAGQWQGPSGLPRAAHRERLRTTCSPRTPTATPQTVVPGPGTGNDAVADRLAALPGCQTSTNITGNNAHAYLDAVSDNKPDAGGDPITRRQLPDAGEPGAAADDAPTTARWRSRTSSTSTTSSTTRCTTRASPRPPATSRRRTSSTKKGDSDSVNAEAQDGGGIDNANFATPPDGVNPRMQMYLWNGLGTHQVVVHAAGGDLTYLAQGAHVGRPARPRPA